MVLLWGIKNTTESLTNMSQGDSQNTQTTTGLFSNENNPISVVSPVASNFYSSVRTRTLIDSKTRYDTFPKLANVPAQLEMDYSRILNKPYFISNIPWSNIATNQLATINIPGDILNNPLAKIPFSVGYV